MAGTQKRRNRNRRGPTHGIAGIPGYPDTRQLCYTEPPRLGDTLVYTHTAAAVPLECGLSPLQTTRLTENREYPYLRSHNTLHTHDRYSDQRKRPYSYHEPCTRRPITRSPDLSMLLFAERHLRLRQEGRTQWLSRRVWYWAFDEMVGRLSTWVLTARLNEKPFS